jgi:hypothetical protein
MLGTAENVILILSEGWVLICVAKPKKNTTDLVLE